MAKLAIKGEAELDSTKHTSVVNCSCQKHVTLALKVVYLPHIVKVIDQGKSCNFCDQKA